MKKMALTIGSALLLFASAVLAAVNINTATAKQLSALHGIGPTKAQAIVKYRKTHGKFKSKTDLTKVHGIGAGTLKKISGDISLGK